MNSIPCIKDRLHATLFRFKFPVKMSEIMPDLTALQAAVKELNDSKKFKKLLEVILKLGNFINGGTFNANAPGFKIDALIKVIIFIIDLT